MKNSIMIAILAAMPLLAQEAAPAPETAQQAPRPEMSEQQKADFKAKMLEKFDANKDGQLDEQEKEAMKAEFRKHHHHRHDGRRGGKSGCCCCRCGERGPRPHGPRRELSEEQKAEFRAKFEAKMLEKFDANKDGQLDEQEKEAMKAEFRKHGHRGPKPECKPAFAPQPAPEAPVVPAAPVAPAPAPQG